MPGEILRREPNMIVARLLQESVGFWEMMGIAVCRAVDVSETDTKGPRKTEFWVRARGMSNASSVPEHATQHSRAWNLTSRDMRYAAIKSQSPPFHSTAGS